VKQHVIYSVLAGVFAIGASSGILHSSAPADDSSPYDYVAPIVFQAAGPNAASIQSTVDQFRAALGGVNNLNAPGPLDGGRREINWDGGGSTATSPAPTPFAGFLVTRGALFTTPGTGFLQAPVEGLASTFGNPTFLTQFQAFSPVRLFTPVDHGVTDVHFFLPGGGNIVAATNGFGAVFSDIDQPDGFSGQYGLRSASVFLRYYDKHNNLLYTSVVPPSPGNASLSFFGAVFSDARVARVRIVTGDVPLSNRDETPRADMVVMDDFIFGEPKSLQ
jgi:hypothetical protein